MALYSERVTAALTLQHRVANVREESAKTMMVLIEEYYKQESSFGDAVVSKEDYERM